MAHPDAPFVKQRDRMLRVLEIAEKFKAALQKRGLTHGRAKCPFCERGYLYGRLGGRKQHLHFQCNYCNAAMME